MNDQNALQNWSSSDSSTAQTLQTILQRKISPALSELKKHRGERAASEVLIALMDNCQAYFNL